MTWTAVGSAIFNDQSSALSITPGASGHFFFAEVINVSNATVTATALTATNITWSTAGTSLTGVTNAATSQCFFGKSSSTSTATTTVTWSGTTPTTIRIYVREFSSSVGSWALDVQGHLDGTGTNVWPSLTPGAGAGELYIGFMLDSGSATAGSTSGYSYDIDATHKNGGAYNPSCPNAATGPTWGDGGHFFGISMLVKETSAAGPSGTVITPVTAARPRPRRRAYTAQITGRPPPAAPNRPGPVANRPRPPRRGLIQIITGRPPPATPNRQPPAPAPRARPPRRGIATIITGRPPPATPSRQPAAPAPRARPPRRGLVQIITGTAPPATTPGTPNRQPAAPAPRARPPRRGIATIITGRPPPATPSRPPAFVPRRSRAQLRALTRIITGTPAPAPPVSGGRPVPVLDDRPWVKRQRAKWYRHGPPLQSWYGSEIPAGVAAAHEAGRRLDDLEDAASADVASGIPGSGDIPADSADADRRLRRRAIDRLRGRDSDGTTRPVWTRHPVVPAAGRTVDHDRSERLIDSYRLPRPRRARPRQYSVPVVQRRQRRSGDSGPGPTAG